MSFDFAALPHLHVFAQDQWHQEACVVGNAVALKALRDAIDRALTGDGYGSLSAFTNDGEGYFAAVVRVDDPDTFDRLAVPYTDEIAAQRDDPAVIYPCQLSGTKAAMRHERDILEKKYPTPVHPKADPRVAEFLKIRKELEPPAEPPPG